MMDKVLNYGIKVVCLTLFILIVNIAYSKINNKTTKFVQINILKITNDFTQNAISIVAKNNNLTQADKMAQAKSLIANVAQLLSQELTDYSKKNNVVILQSQSIATDSGEQIKDITSTVENDIIYKISKDKNGI